MTTEEKAKAYDEALKWMRELYPGLHGATKEDAEHYFPDLRERDDERIRRTLVEYFGPGAQLDLVRGVPIQKIRDWLEKQKEQKPAERIEDSVKFEEGFKAGRESGLRDGQKYVLNNLDSYGLCKPAEWSEEDERRIDAICELLENTSAIHPNYSHRKLIIWLKSLHPQPHWKPSEEQPEVDLKKAAMHVYESWMGGTMDDVRRDMVELGRVLIARKV